MNEAFETLPELTDEQMKEINSCFTPYTFYEKVKVKQIGIAGEPETHEEYDCTCTACNTSYRHYFEGSPKHNDIVICPKCGRNTTLKHKSYGKKSLTETQRVLLFCPENKYRVWLRAFYVYKAYNGDACGNKMLNRLYTKSDEKLTPKPELSETKRYLLEPGSVRTFGYQWSYYGWSELDNPIEPFTSCMGNGRDYCILCKASIKNTFLRYLDIDAYQKAAELFTHQYTFNYGIINPYTTRFIAAFVKYPIIESLIKAGYGEFVAELIINRAPHKRLLNWKAKRINEFFKGLSKPEIRVLHEANYQLTLLLSYSEYKKAVKKPDFYIYSIDFKDFGSCDYITLCTLINKYKLNYTKAVNYLRKQNKGSLQAKLQYWKDYLDFAKRLNYDLKNESVIYPKKLHEAHDTASGLVTGIAGKEQAEAMKALTDRLAKRYGFEYDEYRIVVPQSMQEIINEGKVLGHCVGGYAQRHADSKLTILFIRKKSEPDTPFVTMEVHGKKIIQYHGYKNDRINPLPESVKKFVAEFTAYINNPGAYKKEHKIKKEKTA